MLERNRLSLLEPIIDFLCVLFLECLHYIVLSALVKIQLLELSLQNNINCISPPHMLNCYHQDGNPLSLRVTCDRATRIMHKSIALEMSRREWG